MWSGSHLDSVPNGGWFDGIVGAVAAIEVARCLAENQVPMARPFEAVIFADEEGNYRDLLGSTALLHDYQLAELENLTGRDGDRLLDTIRRLGADQNSIMHTAIKADFVHTFIELHIEQGPVLERRGVEIGVVTSIVGLGCGQLEFCGRQDHAGTMPMGLRRDALVGAGEFLASLPDIARSISDAAVITCGRIEANPGGVSIVPSLVRLHLDFRESHLTLLRSLEERIIDYAQSVADKHELQLKYTRFSLTEPVTLDPHMQNLIEQTAKSQGRTTLRLASGAGHDSQNLAKLTPTGMIFIPSRGGRSHSPAEDTSWESIEQGANVLLHCVAAQVSSKP